jgi:hypothetical protein
LVGCLLQAFKLHEHFAHNDYLFVSLSAMCGIYGFYVLERLLKAVVEHKRVRVMHSINKHVLFTIHSSFYSTIEEEGECEKVATTNDDENGCE